MSTPQPLVSATNGFGGHPRGLYTLFFTEMWERFSFYGMRALLVLFMVDAVEAGGLGLNDKAATAIYGLYTAFVYLLSLPGGWVGDRLLGAQRAVWVGGIIIALGHFTLALPDHWSFFLGLILVVIGSGLLKPNISVIVGLLYPEGGARRDAGFTIFYMGVNLGAAIGPLVCSALGEKINWHYGFGAAGFGMILCLVQFQLTRRHLGTAGRNPHRNSGADMTGLNKAWWLAAAAVVAIVTVIALTLQGGIRVSPSAIAENMTLIIAGIGAFCFAGIFAAGGLDGSEKRRVAAIMLLLLAAAVFWSGFEQMGSSLSLFAERSTQREFGGFEIPAGWFQSFNPTFIVLLAPVFAAVWVRLARRGVDLSVPTKFACALALLGLGFLIMAVASGIAKSGQRVLPTWLIATYLLHTIGEICLSPVGLSAVTTLAPPRFAGLMMGLWFLATSFGNLIAGVLAGRMTGEAGEMPSVCTLVAVIALIGSAFLLALKGYLEKLMRHTAENPPGTHAELT